MQQNFTQFNADATGVQTKVVKGLTLVWSEDDQRFMLPMPEPEKARFKVLFDEQADAFIQVFIENADFIYRDRKATAPDGTVLQERIFIGKDKQGNRVEIPDPEFQKALITAKRLEIMKHALEMSGATVAIFFLACIVSILAFAWQVISNAGVIATSFATGSADAMKEAGYFLAWGVAGIIGFFVLRFSLPLVFASTQSYEQPVGGHDQATTTNITVVNSGGSGNSAQGFIDGRRI